MPIKVDRLFSLRLLRRAVGLFVVFSVLITVVMVYPVISSYEHNRIEVIKTREIGYIDASSQQIERDFFEIVGDIGVAAYLVALKDSRPVEIAAFFKEFAERYGRYDAILLLNPAGREVIRIHHVGKRTVVATEHELRDQSTCPCYKEATHLGPTKIYLSTVIRPTVQVENQRSEPIIQLAQAVASDDGEIKGVVVFNYRGSKMLEELQRIGDTHNHNRISMLVNKEGHWLSDSPLPHAQLPEALSQRGGSFAEQFEAEWRYITGNEHGELRNEKGLFLYGTVYPLKQEGLDNPEQKAAWQAQFPPGKIDSYYAKLVLWLPESSLYATSFARQPQGLAIISFGYVLLAILSASLVFVYLKKQQEEIARRHAEEMERQAYTDSLTAVWNRRYFGEVTQRELLRSQRHYQPLVLLLLDIDHFKRINDTYGHKSGDIVLKEFCRICLGTLREIDLFARLGGEEFVALLPNTSPDNATIAANRLREAVASAKTRLPSGGEISFTVSIGISCLPANSSDLDEILQDADRALYEAKHRGRNQICISPSCTPPTP